MILHFSQMGFTEGRTFMLFSSIRTANRYDRLVYPLALAAPRDAASRQIIGREFNGDLVAGINANEVHAHLSRNMRHDPVPAGELHLEHRVGKSLNDRAFHFNDVTLGQVRIPPCRFSSRLLRSRVAYRVRAH